jgi:hypothetical protein
MGTECAVLTKYHLLADQFRLQRSIHSGAAKHSKSLNLLDSISVGVDLDARNFDSMQKQVEAWRKTELSTVAAKTITTRRSSRADVMFRNT